MGVNFLKNFHSKFKRARYWTYLMLVIVFIIFIFNSLLRSYIASSVVMTVIDATIVLSLIILEQADLGVKELVKFSHNKLLTIKEIYVILLLTGAFLTALFCGNLLHNKTLKEKLYE